MSQPQPYKTVGVASLYLGDCIEVMAGLPAASVQMIFADPPYNLSNDGTTVHAGKRVSVNKGDWDKSKGAEEDFDFRYRWIEQCRRVLVPDGIIWISGTYHSIYACGYALQVQGWRLLNDVSWYKPNAAPNLGCRMFTASHETILWASVSKKSRHLFHYDDMREGSFPSDLIKNPGKRCEVSGRSQPRRRTRSDTESTQPRSPRHCSTASSAPARAPATVGGKWSGASR